MSWDLNRLNAWIAMYCIMAAGVAAQETGPAEVDKLRRQLQEATEKLEKNQQEQRQAIESLQRQIEALTQASPAPGTQASVAAPRSWTLSDPIRVGRGSAYMDLGLVATFAAGGSTAEDIEGSLELGGHDPNQRGFTVQGVEMVLSGAVDPYLRGLATVTFQVDADGETLTELEEAYLQSQALPGNFQVQAGQYIAEFGRHNPQHVHSWSFVDTPLVNGRLLGPDGLRNPGARVSWLAPTPFYSELFLGIQNSHGETASSFRGEAGHHEDEEALPFAYRHADNDRGVDGLSDLLFTPRAAASWEMSDSQVVLAGVSAAFGPNNSGDGAAGMTDTQIYGVDLTWKWKSPRQSGGFPFLQWQTEALWRRYDAGRFDWDLDGQGDLDPGEVAEPGGTPAVLSGERLEDYGVYTQWLYGFRKGWVAGIRWDYVTSDEGDYENQGLTLDGDALGRDPARATRWRLSPNLTWYPTEFSKLRLQYNYDDRSGVGRDHSVWVQFEFLLGAHAAHKF